MAEPLVFFVSGMWCTTCSKSIAAGVGRLPGVVSAEINFSSKLLTVVTEEEDDGSLSLAVEQEVERLGFAAKRQPLGWIQTFREDLEREHSRTVSTVMVTVVGFLAMWSSMVAFSGYLGGLDAGQQYLVSCLSAAFGVPAVLIGMAPFLHAGLRAVIRSRLLTLDLFIGVGGLSAVAISVLNLAAGSPHTYTDSAAMVLVLLLVAKLVEAKLAGYFSGQLLYRIAPATDGVEALLRGEWRSRALVQIRRGDTVRFRAGQTVTLDGRLKSERAAVNSHLLNGEAGDLELSRGAPVTAGTIARTDLEMEVDQPLGHRTIDRWAESALLSQGRPHAYSGFIRLLEGRLTTIALLGAAAVGAVEYLRSGAVQPALEGFFVGVLIFCPCLFASILPLTKQMAHLTLGKLGVLVQRAECLFDLTAVDRIYLDKTGTLEAVDSHYHSLSPTAEGRARELLGEVARRAPHPVLNGLKSELHGNPQLQLAIENVPGAGVVATGSEGDVLVVGRPRFVLERLGGPSGEAAGSDPLVALNGRVVGRIVTRAAFNERAVGLLNTLLELFPPTVPLRILSGDPTAGAGGRFESLAPERISYRGDLTPEQKAELMEGRSLFVGDGLNDTLALSRATVSCRVGQKVQGLTPSDLQVVVPDLGVVAAVVRYSRRYLQVLKQTALLALTYNVIALSLALAGLFNPLGAVLAMLSSLVVLALSSLRLLRLP